MRKVRLSLVQRLKIKGAILLFALRRLRSLPNKFSLYEKAFRQKEFEGSVRSYQRLEFLGDAVIDLAVADYLYRKYPAASEGDMTEIKSRIVNREAMATMSKIVNLDKLMERLPQLNNACLGKEHRLADTLESFIGAVHLDKGYQVAKKCFLRVVKQSFSPKTLAYDNNYKGRLVEWGQRYKRSFFFDNRRIGSRTEIWNRYETSLYIGEEWLSTATGKNKKHAEQKASKKALQQLNISPK